MASVPRRPVPVFRPVVPLFHDLRDLRREHEAPEARLAAGKALREKVPRSGHASWRAAKDRPDPLATVLATSTGRQPELVRLRMGRMALSPFGWLRGAAAVMAWDLSRTPVTGLPVVIDGDAHLANFGLYGTPQREVVFDLNDFDETSLGAWEWDVKRLAVSVNLVGRENGLTARRRRRAVAGCARAYREAAATLAPMGILDVWCLHAFPGRSKPLRGVDVDWLPEVREAAAGAAGHTSATLLPKVAERRAGRWRFLDEPPVLHRSKGAVADAVIGALHGYADSLPLERRYMLRRYRAIDVAPGAGRIRRGLWRTGRAGPRGLRASRPARVRRGRAGLTRAAPQAIESTALSCDRRSRRENVSWHVDPARARSSRYQSPQEEP